MAMFWRSWRLRIIAPLLIILIFGLFSVLGSQIYQQYTALRSAPQDNLQWTLAQLEIEFLTFLNASRLAEAQSGPVPELLDETRTRFNILYSRATTIRESPVFGELRSRLDVNVRLNILSDLLEKSIPIIDSDDDALFANLPAIDNKFEQLRTTTRALSLEGVRIFAVQSDLMRTEMGMILLRTGMIAFFLILALIVSLAILYRQHRLAEHRSETIRRSHMRYASAINASLDAIIVADSTGKVLDFSPAAEKTFGYSRARAIGENVANLIVPPALRTTHSESMQRFVETGVPKLVGAGRFEIDAMHSSGMQFPVEMSIGMSEGADGKPIFISFSRDISRRKAVQRELTDARDQALAADKAKSQFLAVMSHEMRTPLNGVMAVLDLLAGTDLDVRQREFVDTAITSGEILQHHIDDVLDITRIEAGAIDIHPIRFVMKDLLAEVSRSHELAARSRGNSINFSVMLETPRVKLDRNRLRQILLNLVGNAVKFTEDGDIRIDVSDYRDADGRRNLSFVVEDSGTGIAEEDRERIFEDFVTLDSSYKRRAEGYGLGLAICRRISAAMGGTISVESELGEGSRFTVVIPEAELTSRPETDIDEEENQPARDHRDLNVLIVEDNETNRFVAKAMLEEAGCTVTLAVDGADGIAKADQARFDLILMDISMPNIDGLEATRRIREGTGPSRKSPIVMLTAHVMDNEKEIMRELGVRDHLLKPLRRRNLTKVLERLDLEAEQDAPEDESEAGSVLDESVLRELASLLPKERLQQSIDKFCAESEELGAQMTAAIEGGDFDRTQQLAHKHAGSAAMLGAVALAELLRMAQDLSARHDAESLGDLMEEMPALVRKSAAAIREVGLPPAE